MTGEEELAVRQARDGLALGRELIGQAGHPTPGPELTALLNKLTQALVDAGYVTAVVDMDAYRREISKGDQP